MNSRKQEISGDETNNRKILSTTTTPSISSSSRQSSWAAGFKNPRIVRVSRTFGGKDRHSKVCTVKGLRDRRIRLSVPTAIQLYDLQDRLGLNQPSKVVDWLIDATKDEIDKLPPLQMPPPSLSHFFNMKDHHQDFVDATTNHQQENSIDHHFFQSSNLGMFNNNNNWEPNSNLSLGPFGNYHSSFSSSSSSSQDQCHQQQNTTMSFPHQLYFPPYNSNFHPNSLVPTLQLINKGHNLQDHHHQQHNHKEGNGGS